MDLTGHPSATFDDHFDPSSSRYEFFKRVNDLSNQRSGSPSRSTSQGQQQQPPLERNNNMLFTESPFSSSFGSSFDPFERHMAFSSSGTEIPINIAKSPASTEDQTVRSRSNSNTMASGSGGEPRVHHIPIHIEGRDRVVPPTRASPSPSSTMRSSRTPTPTRGGESPYFMTTNASPPAAAASSSPHVPRRTSPFVEQENRFSSSPPKASFERGPQHPHVRQIPVVREFNPQPEGARTRTPGGSLSRNRGGDVAVETENGPFVTRIPVNITKTKPASPQGGEQEDSDRSRSPAPPKVRKTPMQEVEEINQELSSLNEQISTFSGHATDKQYRFLDEMLTRLLIKLDNIDTQGQEDVRTARKQAVAAVHAAVTLLESKARKEEAETQHPEVEMNGAEVGTQGKEEPPSEEKMEEEHQWPSTEEVKEEKADQVVPPCIAPKEVSNGVKDSSSDQKMQIEEDTPEKMPDQSSCTTDEVMEEVKETTDEAVSSEQIKEHQPIETSNSEGQLSLPQADKEEKGQTSTLDDGKQDKN